jgi:hypothetical protein
MQRGITIWDYVQHWNEYPWFDTGNYEWWQIALFLTGAVLWILVYIDTIYHIVKYQTVNIPLIAICLNFGFEVTTSFVFVPNMGKVLVIAYWAWMVLDCYIVYNMFKYGWKQIRLDFFKPHLTKILAVGVIMGLALQFFFITEYDLPMAPLSGYIISLEMTMCYMYLLFIPGFIGNTKLTGWSKFIGNGLISIMFQTKYPENHFLTTLYICTAFFDIWYIYLLYTLKPADER